jgi:peptidoglycan DL-endopeptidase CwlO
MGRASARRSKTHSGTLSMVAGAAAAFGSAVVAVGLVAADASTLQVSTASARPATVQANERFAARRKAAALSARAGESFIWPVSGAVTGQFGEPRSGHIHDGIDIPTAMGTPIKAAQDGRVVMREVQAGYGNYTCLAHEDLLTCYGHQSRFRSKLGARVNRGEVIGYVGNSGNAPAVHLHFEVRRGVKPWGKPLDPMRYLPPG